jgi:serine/threonine-protein kinase
MGSSAVFCELLYDSGLLNPAQNRELADHLTAEFQDPTELARVLIKRGWLTAYQVRKIARRKAHRLFLDSYILLAPVGRGGMGKVYKAWHRSLRRLAAIKVLDDERVADPETAGRFQREIRLVGRLEHPHIVRAYDAGTLDNTYYLAMEFVDGPSLAHWVQEKGTLTAEQAYLYGRQALLGLQHAFERGLVHRDIKPANLLLTADATTVKIADFGLASLANGGIHSSQVLLTRPGPW